MSEIVKAIRRYLIDHDIEDAALILCNLLLELLDETDEEFTMDVVSAVMANEPFELHLDEED